MDLLDELKALDVDVEAGLQRLGGNKNLYTQIVDLLRKDQPEQAREQLEKILPVQEKIVACINKYM